MDKDKLLNYQRLGAGQLVAAFIKLKGKEKEAQERILKLEDALQSLIDDLNRISLDKAKHILMTSENNTKAKEALLRLLNEDALDEDST